MNERKTEWDEEEEKNSKVRGRTIRVNKVRDKKKKEEDFLKEYLNEEAIIEYTGFGLQFDPVSFAGYRADARTNKDIGNMMNNINKSIALSLKQSETWKQLVQVETEKWTEKQNSVDKFQGRKNDIFA